MLTCLQEIPLPRADLYLPTNPESRIMALLPQTGTPMQSAAKVPLLVAFTVSFSDLSLPRVCAAPNSILSGQHLIHFGT